MSSEPRVTKTIVVIETLNKDKRVTDINVSVETNSSLKDSRTTVVDIVIETQTTSIEKRVTSVLMYIEWNYPSSKYAVQMI